jgi:two-component system osmolarity sensor histidine kinase EnvZ
MSFSLKRFLPKTLFGRSLLIIITPVLILQVLGTYIFYDRHWSRMTDRLAFALVGEIAIITGEIEVGRSAEDIDRISDIIARDLKLNINYDANLKTLPPERIDGWRQQMVAQTLKDGLKGRLNMPFSLFFGEDGRWLDVSFLLENGVLTVSVPENRLFSSSSYIFILWLIGLSVVLFSIAVIFMRNQIRPIRRLAVAAEWFGRGRDIPDFKPHGAKEVRQASNAFITMRDRIKRQISQRTEMLAGVSHDLRTPLTRMKLELELLDDRDSKAIRADIADMKVILISREVMPRKSLN